jgi:hypothetical protein
VLKSPINADKVLTTDQENQRPSRVLLMLASEKAFFSDANLTGNSPLGRPPVGPSPFPWLDAEARCPVPGVRCRLNHLPFGLQRRPRRCGQIDAGFAGQAG